MNSDSYLEQYSPNIYSSPIEMLIATLWGVGFLACVMAILSVPCLIITLARYWRGGGE